MCPIKTPEGPNIGLINNIHHTDANHFGQTPYRKKWTVKRWWPTKSFGWQPMKKMSTSSLSVALSWTGGFAEPIVIWDITVVSTRVPIWSSRLHGRISKTSSCRCDMFLFLSWKTDELQPCPHDCNMQRQASIDWSKSPLCGYWVWNTSSPWFQELQSLLQHDGKFRGCRQGRKFVGKMVHWTPMFKNSVVQTPVQLATNVLWLKLVKPLATLSLMVHRWKGNGPWSKPNRQHMTGRQLRRMPSSRASNGEEDVTLCSLGRIQIRNTRYQVRPEEVSPMKFQTLGRCSSWLGWAKVLSVLVQK